jgi:hypothetical protein
MLLTKSVKNSLIYRHKDGMPRPLRIFVHSEKTNKPRVGSPNKFLLKFYEFDSIAVAMTDLTHHWFNVKVDMGRYCFQ